MGTKVSSKVIGGLAAAVVVAGAGVAVFVPTHHGNAAKSTAVASAPQTALRGAGSVGGSGAGSVGLRGAGSVAGSGAGSGVASGAGSVAAGGGTTTAGAATPEAAASGAPSAATTPSPSPSPVGPSTTPVTAPADTVVRTGSLDVEVGRGGFARAFSAAAGVARAEGGFVVSAQMGPGTPTPIPDGVDSVGPTSAPAQAAPPTLAPSPAPTDGTLELRIPSSHFDDARAQLERLGTLRGENLSGQDAGGQLSDLSAQLADLHAEQDGLRAMAARATSSSDLLAIQNQLAAVQQQIDGLTAQQNTLQNEVALASITITLHEVVPAATTPPARSVLDARLAQAGRGVEAVTGGIVVVLAYAGPLVALAGLIGLIVLGVRRRRPDRLPPEAIIG